MWQHHSDVEHHLVRRPLLLWLKLNAVHCTLLPCIETRILLWPHVMTAIHPHARTVCGVSTSPPACDPAGVPILPVVELLGVADRRLRNVCGGRCQSNGRRLAVLESNVWGS